MQCRPVPTTTPLQSLLSQETLQLKLFIQTRSSDQPGLWLFLYPIHPTYGYDSIEAAETAITELEQQDEEWGLEFEYRMKEELV